MIRTLLEKGIQFLLLLIGISFLSFLLIHLTPSDPAEVALRVNEITPTEEAIAGMREELGLNEPFFIRYKTWVLNSLQGDFGTSFITKKPVIEEIKRALPNTLYLSFFSLLIILVVSISFAFICTYYEETWLDRIVRGFVFIGDAMPSFWLGLLLIWLLSVKFNLFPTSGMDGVRSVILPAATLAVAHIATFVRLLRNKMIENKEENYVLYARARGLKERVIFYHIFKNSLHSSMAAIGMAIPTLIAGTVVIENVFAWPGIGMLSISAIFNYDYPVIQAYILLMTVLFVFFNMFFDLMTKLLDPTFRNEA